MSARVLALLLVLGAAAGCSNDTSNPVGPTWVPSTSFTWATTFTARGSATRSFEQIGPGAVNITLTAVTPDVPLGIGVGIPRADGSGCLLTTAVTATPASSPQIVLTADPGTWCVRVWDPGTVPERVNFSMSVIHN
jgi:hypothetical protein